MNWQPGATVATAAARANMLGRARQFFGDRNVLEVTTPALTSRTATDPNIESLVATANHGKYFLHTSPEHYMKRLLAAGYPDMFQICNVFRDGEAGRHHLTEFTMLEWYRAGFTQADIIRETCELAEGLLSKRALQAPSVLTYQQVFAEALSLDALTADIEALASAARADADLRRALGDDRDAWLDLCIATLIAPTFPTDRLTVVYHYPASQAALARLSPADSRVAERFELYCGPMELANGFVELQDAGEQRKRFDADRERRRTALQPVHDIDERLLAALQAGLPPCAGVALGLDRVLMIDENLADIRAAVTFIPGS